MKTIAIIPGSFKPPHLGHLKLIEKLLENKNIDKIYIIVSGKPRGVNTLKDNYITVEQSIPIWKIYLKNLGDNVLDKVEVVRSVTDSPITMGYYIANKELKKGDKLILVKSSKDVKNKRFDSYNELSRKGIKINYLVIKQFKKLSSTNMRHSIKYKNKKELSKFFPDGLTEKDKKEIYMILEI